MKARTIEEISDSVKANFMNSSFIRDLYGISQIPTNPVNEFNSRFSPSALESQLIIVLAISIATLEQMLYWFKADIEEKINSERYGHINWYRDIALKFQYGEGINPIYSQDSNDSDFAEIAVYENENEDLKPIKFAFATTHGTGLGVTIKIATLDGDALAPLLPEIEEVFESYMNRVKPAGIPLYIINSVADRLYLKLDIYYDPLIMRNNGSNISDNLKPVDEAIKQYLNGIEFNGEFVSMKLVDVLQQIHGVKIVEIAKSMAASASNDLEEFVARYSPKSGYLKLDFMHDFYPNYKLV